MGRSLSEGAKVIRLLGPFSVELTDYTEADEAVWRRAHARYLIQMVGSNPRRVESRAKVLQALWPGFDEARARNRLHHTVHWIRKGVERFPVAVRPQLVVGADHVELILADGTCTDVQAFLDALECDTDNEAGRLAALEQALSWYRGPLAPDWTDLGEIAARRAWLDGMFAQALSEAVDLAESLGAVDVALKYAQRRAQHLRSDVESQCSYMRLLARQGCAEAALLHGQSFRSNATELDAAGLAALDAVVREVQQQVNRATAGVVASALDRPMVVGVSRLPAPRPILGYVGLQKLLLQALKDPFNTIVSVIGPPGCGKTILAEAVVHRLVDHFKHGVCWVQTDSESAGKGWEAAIASARGLDTDADLLKDLRGKELLMVLDGLNVPPHELPRLATLVEASRDSRWLVTTTTFLRVRGEKVLVVDPALLLEERRADESASPAAQLLAQGQHGWSLADKRIRSCLEGIALALGGLPILLERASWALHTALPSELLARLAHDPTHLLQAAMADIEVPPVDAGVTEPGREVGARSNRHADALKAWLEQAPPDLLELVRVAALCRRWLSWDDLLCLGQGLGLSSVENLVDHGFRLHYLQRRVCEGHETTWSEFRVPRYVVAALSLFDCVTANPKMQAALVHWLSRGPQSSLGENPAGTCQTIRWIDDHIEDMESLVEHCLELGLHEDVARLCVSHASHWVRSAHVHRVLGWLIRLGERAEGVPDELAAPLLVVRAQLRAHLGKIQRVFEDASRALERLANRPDAVVRQQAELLLERYGTAGAAALRGLPRLDEGAGEELGRRAIETGESLLYAAMLTARSGALPKALEQCREAAGVFSHFGLSRGLLKAHQHSSSFAYAMGNTDVAWQFAQEAEQTARAIGDEVEALRAELLRGRVLLAKLQVSQAIEQTSKVVAKLEVTNHPPLLGRGLLLLGWTQYYFAAYPIVRVLCKEVRELVDGKALTDLVDQVEMLSALVDARQGHREAAIRRLFRVLDQQPRSRPIHDRQADLINAADLVVHLGRPDLALTVLESLRVFGSAPDHALRPWVVERMQGLQRQIQENALTPETLEAEATEKLLKLMVGSI